MTRFFILLLAFTACATTAFFPSALAQDGDNPAVPYYGPFGEEDEEPVINQYDKQYKSAPTGGHFSTGLLPGQTFEMNFVRTAETKPGDATLRLISPVTLNGCVDMTQPFIETKKNGNILRVKVSDPIVDVDRSVRYAHYDCKQGAFTASADITLNKGYLRQNNIKAIAFQAGSQTDFYDVELSKSYLRLVPRSTKSFKPRRVAGKADSLHYNFYPKNMLLLYVPSAKKGMDLYDSVNAAAVKHGMINAHEYSRALPRALQNGKGFYFIDQTGELSESLDFGKSIRFGKVTVDEHFRGPQGGYARPKELDIFARLPGALD